MVESLLKQFAISGVGVIFVFVGLYTMNKGRRKRAQSERIADTETTPVRELQPGTVEVKGEAQPAEAASLVHSPITNQEAVATYVEMEEWESSGQGGGNWQTKHESQTAVPMTVDDGTGEVRVELPADGVVNVEETQWEVNSGDEPPEQIERYLETESEIETASRHDIGPLSVGDRRRYSEGVIEPGEDVYVLGLAREQEAGWGDRDFVIDDPTDAGDFILSDKSEETLIREGKRSALVSLAFGGVLGAVGLVVAVIPWVSA